VADKHYRMSRALRDWEALRALDEGKVLEVWIDETNGWIVPDPQDRLEYVYEINSGAKYRLKVKNNK